MNQLYAAYGTRVAFLAIPGSDTGMDGASPESQLDVLNFQIRFNVKYPIASIRSELDRRQTLSQGRLSDDRRHRSQQNDRLYQQRRDPL